MTKESAYSLNHTHVVETCDQTIDVIETSVVPDESTELEVTPVTESCQFQTPLSFVAASTFEGPPHSDGSTPTTEPRTGALVGLDCHKRRVPKSSLLRLSLKVNNTAFELHTKDTDDLFTVGVEDGAENSLGFFCKRHGCFVVFGGVEGENNFSRLSSGHFCRLSTFGRSKEELIITFINFRFDLRKFVIIALLENGFFEFRKFDAFGVSF